MGRPPSGGGTPPPSSSSVQEWFDQYSDPIDFYSAPLAKPSGQWLQGLKKPDGSYVAILTPLQSGVGDFVLYSHFISILENQGTVAARCRVDIGVSNSNGPNFPMYPYWGYMHGRGDYPYSWCTVPVGQAVYVSGMRIDYVTGEKMAANGTPIPNWPNWTIQPASNGKPPALVVVAGCDTDGAVVVAKCTQFYIRGLKGA